MLIFALQATRELGAGIAEALGVELAPHEEREFEDGEHKARPLISVRGRDLVPRTVAVRRPRGQP
jgi:ribose-phosphate pyrophosphokinase